MAAYRARQIQTFLVEELQPKLPSDFLLGRNQLLRLVANAAQVLFVSLGRGGDSIKVIPTFYIVGARPWEEQITNALSVGATSPNRWRFQDQELNEAFAERICAMVAAASPVSFFSPVDKVEMSAGMRNGFTSPRTYPDGLFSCAFFDIANRITGSHELLRQSKREFQLANRAPLHAWQERTIERMDSLLSRYGTDELVATSRLEAEQHARDLGLPGINWQ